MKRKYIFWVLWLNNTVFVLFCIGKQKSNKNWYRLLHVVPKTTGFCFFPDLPLFLQKLLQNETQRFKHFLKYIRGYNNALIFTFCKYQQNTRLQGRGGIQFFTIHGELYHLQIFLHASMQTIPFFVQLYFYDPVVAATFRLCQHPDFWQFFFKNWTR